ncbi:MAG TPA: molybdopterin oxidoreductase family protein [Ktedonobacterales bacterium]
MTDLPAGTEVRVIRGACPHDCPDTCATVTTVRDGRAVAFEAAPEHPITQGWLCAKVRPYLERVYHPERLQYPLRRVGAKGEGSWERISWDVAIEEISSRWKAIIAERGAAAILPYSYSGTLGVLNAGVCDQRLWNRMGASGLNRTICDASGEAAVMATYGARWAPDMRDIPQSKLIILWGSNPATSGPHLMPFLREAQRRGAYVVVIDPRRSLTAKSADEYIQPYPATDGALALGVAHVLFAERLSDDAWLEANTVGWRELRERAAEYPPERVAGITGVPASVITGLARRYGATRPALLKFSDGVQRHGNGGQAARALACLPAIVGQVGVRGGGIFYSAGGYAQWDREAVGHASECPPPSRVINMNRLGAALTGEASDPPIQSLYVYNANPAASTPNSQRVIAGLLRDDLFTVVHELFLTDTARYADIVLPATTQLEQVDLHRAYGHRFITYNERAIEPLAESKSNWDVMRLLAAGMGYEESWLREDSEAALHNILEATSRSNPYMHGVTMDRLKSRGYVELNFEASGDVPFADLRFPTPSGKVELRSEAMMAEGLDPLPNWEPAPEYATWHPGSDERLALVSGASHHFVSSSMANVPSLMRREGSAFVELNAADAEARGITSGMTVEVSSARGSCQLRAVVTTTTAPGIAVAPKGQWQRLSPDGRNINWTTSDALSDLAGGATFHDNLVTVRPVSPTPQVGKVTATLETAEVFHSQT